MTVSPCVRPRLATLCAAALVGLTACNATEPDRDVSPASSNEESQPRYWPARSARSADIAEPAPPTTIPVESRAAPVPTARRASPPSLRARLRSEKLSGLDFSADNGGYLEVMRTIRAVTSIPIITTPEARQAIRDEGLSLDLQLTAPLAVRSLLDHMAAKSDALSWTVQNDVVVFQAAGQADATKLAYYDVRSLIYPRTTFIAPKIGGIPTGDSEVSRTGAESDETVRTFEADELLEVLRIGTDPKYWESDSNANMEITDSGTLIARATPAVHAQLRAFLGL